MGVGAVVGGLVTATRGRTGLRPLTVAAALFGVAILIAALSPMLAVAFVAMAAVGWTSVSFLATGNSTLQLAAKPAMRGRVMALWAVAFLGSTPIGGPLIGWIVAIANARVGLAVGIGLPCLRGSGCSAQSASRRTGFRSNSRRSSRLRTCPVSGARCPRSRSDRRVRTGYQGRSRVSLRRALLRIGNQLAAAAR